LEDRRIALFNLHRPRQPALFNPYGQQLMKSMGEAMWLTSEVDKGSKFYFTLKRV
jgi:hypothetical protein